MATMKCQCGFPWESADSLRQKHIHHMSKQCVKTDIHTKVEKIYTNYIQFS